MLKLSLFKQSPIIASGYIILVEKTVVYIIDRKIHEYILYILKNTRFISRLVHDMFNTRKKSGISALLYVKATMQHDLANLFSPFGQHLYDHL